MGSRFSMSPAQRVAQDTQQPSSLCLPVTSAAPRIDSSCEKKTALPGFLADFALPGAKGVLFSVLLQSCQLVQRHRLTVPLPRHQAALLQGSGGILT